jgi:hypothetical protein
MTKPSHWFDENVFYLGELCPNEHGWGTSNKSLRLKSSDKCTKCNRVQVQRKVSKPKKQMPKKLTEEEITTFWNTVAIGSTDECWQWQGEVDDKGYGKFNSYFGNAHRIAYSLSNKEIPDGVAVIRTCHTHGCVNPAHLTLGKPFDEYNRSKNK